MKSVLNSNQPACLPACLSTDLDCNLAMVQLSKQRGRLWAAAPGSTPTEPAHDTCCGIYLHIN